MNIKLIECMDCGKIYNRIEELKVIYTKDDNSYNKHLICPNCGEDKLNFIVNELKKIEYKKPTYSIAVYKLDFKNNDLIDKEIVYRPAIKFEYNKGYYLSENEKILEFKTLEEAKEYADEYGKKIAKNLEDIEFRQSFEKLKNKARELNGNQVF